MNATTSNDQHRSGIRLSSKWLRNLDFSHKPDSNRSIDRIEINGNYEQTNVVRSR